MSKQPLAFTLRPKTLEDVIGQKHLVGPNCLLTRMVKSGKPINIIFYGNVCVCVSNVELWQYWQPFY